MRAAMCKLAPPMDQSRDNAPDSHTLSNGSSRKRAWFTQFVWPMFWPMMALCDLLTPAEKPC